MQLLVSHVILIGLLDPTSHTAHAGQMTGPPVGAWRILNIIDGPASSRDRKTVRIAGERLIVTGGEESEEYAIVRIKSAEGIAAIDLRDLKNRRTYLGIYQSEGKRLQICIQFWTTGNAKASVRPESFQEANPVKVFGGTLY